MASDDYAGWAMLNSALSGATAVASGYADSKKAYDYSRGLNQQLFHLQDLTMGKQNYLAQENWKMVNKYNDPSAEASRYRAAGINPISAMGVSQGDTIAAPSGSATSGGSAHGPGRFTPPDLIAAADQHQIAQATKLNIEADTRKKESDIGNTDVDTALKSFDLAMRPLLDEAQRLANENQRLQNYMDGVEASFKAIKEAQDVEARDEAIRKCKAEIDRLADLHDLHPHEKANLMALKLVYDAQVKHLESAANLAGEQAKTEGNKRDNLDSLTDLNKANAKTEDALRESRKGALDAEADLKRAQKQTEDALRSGRIESLDLQNLSEKERKAILELQKDIEFANKYISDRTVGARIIEQKLDAFWSAFPRLPLKLR